MNKFFKLPISTALIIVGIIIALLAWIKPYNSEKKDLDYSISQNSELIASDKVSNDNSLEFKYNGEKISNLISTKIRIKNTGNQPIQRSDFIQGLNIIFPSNIKIVNSKISQIQFIKNENMQETDYLVKNNDNEITFTPILINPNEIFDIDVLFTVNDPQYLKNVNYEFEPSKGINLIETTNYSLKDGQKIKYNQEDITINYKIYGITKINQVSNINPNSEQKENAKESLRGLLRMLIVFFIIPIGIILLISFFIKIFKNNNRESSEPKAKKENEKKGGIKKEDIVYIIIISIVAGALLIALFSLMYKAWFLPV